MHNLALQAIQEWNRQTKQWTYRAGIDRAEVAVAAMDTHREDIHNILDMLHREHIRLGEADTLHRGDILDRQDGPATLEADSAVMRAFAVDVQVVLERDYRQDKNAVHQQDASLMTPIHALDKQAQYNLHLMRMLT